MLRTSFFSAAEIAAIVRDYHTAGLKPAEVALMALAEKVTLEANSVTQADIDGVKAYGLADEEVMDIILAASLRSFFSKTLDALGVAPDECYHEQLEPELVAALAIGRPFAPAALATE